MRTDRPKLPRPDIDAQTSAGGTVVDIVVSRDGKAKSYHGSGGHNGEAVKEAVRKILDDPQTAEWLP